MVKSDNVGVQIPSIPSYMNGPICKAFFTHKYNNTMKKIH